MKRTATALDLADRAVFACALAAYLALLVALEWPCWSADLYVASDPLHREVCFESLCFVPAAKSDVARIFGFAEFISSLALLVIVYTLVDVRYRFRIAVAPLPLYRLTFAAIAVIGVESLLAEFWLADQLWLPETAWLTRSIWQAGFGALFLSVFMAWMWFAFIRPPVFNSRNAVRYFRELYRLIVRGDETELAVLADELGRSAESLVEHCPDLPEDAEIRRLAFSRATEAQQHAVHVFGLIANRKFCRAIVVNAPTTAILLFDSASRQKKYRVPMATFSKNVSSEAIANTDSNLYHETEPYDAGLLGQMKPFSEAIYGDFRLVESLGSSFGSPLDIDYQAQRKWTADHWEAYARATLIVLRSYLRTTGGHQHSFVLSRALHDMQSAYSDFYQLGEGEQIKLYESDQFKRFTAIVRFISDAVKVLSEEVTAPPRKMKKRGHARDDLYDQLADLMFEIVCAAATIKQESFATWHIQYSSTWTELFDRGESSDLTEQLIQFKLRRKIYDSVNELSSHVNYQAASVLGLCLSVCGLYDGPQTPRSYRPLARALKQWTQREYPKLRQRDLDLANAVLFGSISFDERKHAIVKTYVRIGSKPPAQTFLPLDGQPSPVSASAFRRVKVAARGKLK